MLRVESGSGITGGRKEEGREVAFFLVLVLVR